MLLFVGEHRALAGAFIDGVAAASPEAVAACFTPDARMRALIPPGPLERLGGSAASEELGDDFTVQQQVYAEVVDGRFKDLTLLCSGFRPRRQR
jgi:hypothetical protein